MKLSIIVCVYNTPREYLEKCLSSLTRSTLSLGEYEICMVDDGSDSDYRDTAEKYGAKYTRHENRGILYSRLRGIEIAEGDYIAFVDSDDTVSVNYHYPMLSLSDGNDIVVNDWAFHTSKCKYSCTLDKYISGDVYKTGDEILPYFVSEGGRQHSFYVLWNKIFRSEILKKAAEELKQIADKYPSYNYSEDALIAFFAHKHAKSLVNIHTGYYFYRIHSGQSVSVENKDKLISHIDCMSRTLDIMYAESGDHPMATTVREGIDEWRALMSRTHYSYAKMGKHTELYPYIMEKYKVERLEKSTLSDGRYYLKVRVLPKNLCEIDTAIYEAFSEGAACQTDSASLCSYAYKTLLMINDMGGRVEFSASYGVVIPKGKCNVMQTIIHNYTISRIGLMLFPKGSRIRAFLKKHL